MDIAYKQETQCKQYVGLSLTDRAAVGDR